MVAVKNQGRMNITGMDYSIPQQTRGAQQKAFKAGQNISIYSGKIRNGIVQMQVCSDGLKIFIKVWKFRAAQSTALNFLRISIVVNCHFEPRLILAH